MRGIEWLNNAEWLEEFNHKLSSDITFNLYNNLSSDESIRAFWDKCSDFYHLSCFPFDGELEKWVDVPDIYEILKKFAHTADGHPLDVLICKFNEKTMEEAKQQVEELRKRCDGMEITIAEPYPYIYMVWFFGGSSWRTAQYVLWELRNNFPEKFKEIKHK